jgi:HrpA-like RNA helicase
MASLHGKQEHRAPLTLQGTRQFSKLSREVRQTLFDGLDVEEVVRGLDPTVEPSVRAWWEASAAESAKFGGKIMNLYIEFVAKFVKWVYDAPGEPDGAILVFCTGFDDIKVIHDMLVDARKCGRLNGAIIIPLHGSMPTVHQQSVFGRPPAGQRKILLSTNIAETSITIDDVTTVVDCGLHKITTYDALNKIRMLQPSWCGPRSSMRAGGA